MRRFGLVIICSLALVTGAQGAQAGADVVAKIQVGAQACSAAKEAGSVWETVFGTDEVVRIDPDTNKVVRRISVDAGPCGIIAGAGAVWLMSFQGETVQRIDG